MKKKKVVAKKRKVTKRKLKAPIAHPEKIETVMHEFKEGELPIGRSKKKVKSRKQAIAIALSESRKKKRK